LQGDSARLLVRMVAIVARMSTELEHLRSSGSPQVAKTHSDSLAVLLRTAATALENAAALLAAARESGISEAMLGLGDSVQKLRERFEHVPRALAAYSSQGTKRPDPVGDDESGGDLLAE
jgi:hypothetical protein